MASRKCIAPPPHDVLLRRFFGECHKRLDLQFHATGKDRTFRKAVNRHWALVGDRVLEFGTISGYLLHQRLVYDCLNDLPVMGDKAFHFVHISQRALQHIIDNVQSVCLVSQPDIQFFKAAQFFNLSALEDQRGSYNTVFLPGIMRFIPPEERARFASEVADMLVPGGNLFVVESFSIGAFSDITLEDPFPVQATPILPHDHEVWGRLSDLSFPLSIVDIEHDLFESAGFGRVPLQNKHVPVSPHEGILVSIFIKRP